MIFLSCFSLYCGCRYDCLLLCSNVCVFVCFRLSVVQISRGFSKFPLFLFSSSMFLAQL